VKDAPDVVAGHGAHPSGVGGDVVEPIAELLDGEQQAGDARVGLQPEGSTPVR
jgi:hypothetical protein